jgi:hypothetical protein
MSASLAGDGITERLTGARMSANVFEVLGVRPSAGRLLNRLSLDGGHAIAARTAVLGDRPVAHAAGGAGERGALRSISVRTRRRAKAPD